jgi:hypothetical protein
MLAEIAAANAAFQVIKTALENGKELYDVTDHATKFFDNKSAIAKRANRSGSKDDMACFMEMEKIKAQEEWLREHMIYAGRPDMYQDWLKFQSERKRARAKAERDAKRQRDEDMELLVMAACWLVGTLLVFPILIFIGLKLFKVI